MQEQEEQEGEEHKQESPGTKQANLLSRLKVENHIKSVRSRQPSKKQQRNKV